MAIIPDLEDDVLYSREYLATALGLSLVQLDAETRRWGFPEPAKTTHGTPYWRGFDIWEWQVEQGRIEHMAPPE